MNVFPKKHFLVKLYAKVRNFNAFYKKNVKKTGVFSQYIRNEIYAIAVI